METRIEKDTLIIEIPLQTPTPSKSGKMMLVASTGGWQKIDAEVEGKQLRMNLTAGFYTGDKG